MKRLIQNILHIAAIAVVLSAATLFAQSPKVTAKVPFEFVAGGQTLPAGEYTIERNSNSTVTIQDATGNVHLVVLSQPVSKSGVTTPGAALVFELNQGKTFLSQVWTGKERNGRQLVQTHTAGEKTVVAQGR